MAITRWQPPASPFEELNRMRQEMDQGVLRLALPKVEKVKPRKIAVSAG
jgi:hypothetical protein